MLENKSILKYKKKILKLHRELLISKNKIKQLKKENEILRMQVNTDSLTKLNNRRCLEKAVGIDSLILGDLDHFKKINDSHGHDVGDEVLVEVSIILKKYVRDTDLVCRWGGEEFLVLLKNCSDEEALNKANLLKDKIMELSDKFGFRITMSFGISNLSTSTLEDAISKADKAMYVSKKEGRNKATIYTLNK